ncbi:MAG: DUF4190 domain-containing protein [Oscillospiraceae bacterium]|nr:DUF4190 domain-containing protein [Oscillospiraceae bacterium]
MENKDFNNNYNNGYNNNGSGENPKTLAIVGFVLSFFIALAGLIVSAIALNKYKQTGYTEGKGFATAGLVISIVSMGISLLVSVCYGAAIMAFLAGEAAGSLAIML